MTDNESVIINQFFNLQNLHWLACLFDMTWFELRQQYVLSILLEFNSKSLHAELLICVKV